MGNPADPADTIHVLTVGEERPDASLAIVADALGARHPIVFHHLDLQVVAEGLSGEARRTHELFLHTPQPLVDSWLCARAIADIVPDGHIVLTSDRSGLGGVLCLSEAQRPRDRRRRVWTVAGAGHGLIDLVTYGTIDHIPMPEASAVDWEIVQYQYSERVLVLADVAAEAVEALGGSPELAIESRGEAGEGDLPAPIRAAWAPGAVSRRNRSGDVLRAVASLPEVSIEVGAADVVDEVWNGTTWEALAAIRSIIGDRLVRSDTPSRLPDVVIWGDPLAPPDASTLHLADQGVPVLAVRGSAAEAMIGAALAWDDSDELATILGDPSAAGVRSPHRRSSRRPVVESVDRARNVSVGVPVFGRPDHLEACVRSILAQTQPPAEVLLIDDGSGSGDVEAALERWQEDAAIIRVLRQPNRGVCVARNRMIAEMRGDAFLLVDQDDELHPQFIAATASALRADASLVAAATWTEFFGDYSAVEAKPPFDRRVATRENPIVSTAALVDMSVRDRGVAFEPDLAFIYCEDWNYWSQIVASGGRMGLVPAPLIRHRVHRASGGFQRTELAHAIGRARALEPFHRV